MERKLTITDLDLRGKRVLVRVDFNVPLDASQEIVDDTRIKETLPTIQYVLDHGGSVILMSHLGRPEGKRVPELSLAPCAKCLSELLSREVEMAPDCIGISTNHLSPGKVLLLENLRFHEAEEHPEKDPAFAKKLASLADCYVNDAFGTAHRSHSSNVAITQYFSGKAAAGFLIEKEIKFLGNALLKPERPFYAIIGGAKISTKIGVMKALRSKVDALFVGGGMAYTFFKAQGIAIGNSIHEDELLDETRLIIDDYSAAKIPLLLPLDLVVADRLDSTATTRLVKRKEGIPPGFEGVDIGPETIQSYVKELQNAKTVFWNGPLGAFEIDKFAKGTNTVAQALANLSATTVVGGGDSIAALHSVGVADKMTHISTGGGASLKYVEKGTLPAIEALSNSKFDI